MNEIENDDARLSGLMDHEENVLSGEKAVVEDAAGMGGESNIALNFSSPSVPAIS